ncbi:hypothetical protein CCZ01_01935 [Helicobacter monodelphidis]|uniref:hypothetical protein n=1 Tax=Helicobacter sp. 15-1451 TaxID=2004995 RepID=UPI000DCB2188|nr:hypothetical protein [Helicobacter sp. 15-1451]RAX58567.1 hypothetical protein CCZ01_01935 [Helicobacter sp. 15-1451]
MEQIGLNELARHIYDKMNWFRGYVAKHPIGKQFKAEHFTPKMPIQEVAQKAYEILKNPEGILIMRQSLYRNTKSMPIPAEVYAYSLYDDAYPLIFLNAQKTLEEQTHLLFVGVIRILLANDGYYSLMFDSSIKDSYAEKVYYNLSELAGSEVFLEPIRTEDSYYERESALSDIFMKAVRDCLYSGKLSNRDAAGLLDVSERTLVAMFP